MMGSDPREGAMVVAVRRASVLRFPLAPPDDLG